MDKKLTEEEIKILKIISRNNNLRFQNLLERSRGTINRLIARFHQTEPVLNDLKKQGVKINSLEDPLHPDFTDEAFIESLPILIKWLKKESLPDHVKASIINVLIEKPIAKKYGFDVILDIYKSTDPNSRDEWGYKTDLPIMLGNALLRWADDEHAEIIFSLLKNDRFRKDGFLIGSFSNFKNPDNKKKAAKILMEVLQQPDLPNALLGTILSTLRELKAVEVKDMLKSLTNFPENYVRTREITPKEHRYVTDTQIRNEVKKTIEKFNKLQD